MKSTLLSTSAILLLCLTAAQATPLWNIDFSSDFFTPGEEPVRASATAGEVNDRPTGISYGSAGNSILVQQSFTAGSTTMTGQPVVMSRTYGGGDVVMALTGNSADYTSPAPFTLSFDMMLRADTYNEGQDTGAGNFLEVRLHNNTASGTQNLMRMIFISSGRLHLLNDFGVNQIFQDVYSLEQIHNIHGVMNADATQFTVFSGTQEIASVNWTYPDDEVGEFGGLNTITFRNGTTTDAAVWSGALNNIRVAPIPEPSTTVLGFALLAAVGCLILKRKGRILRSS